MFSGTIENPGISVPGFASARSSFELDFIKLVRRLENALELRR
jgi:hypothetical protein